MGGRRYSSVDPEQWVALFSDDLYRYALSRVRDPDTARTCVQETFLAALKNPKSFRGEAPQKAWLLGILKHKIIDHFRQAARYQDESMTDEDDRAYLDRAHARSAAGAPRASSVFKTDDLLERHDFWEVFHDCLNRLPPATRAAFVMREMEGLSGEDICRRLNITSANLWVKLHRARDQLRRCLTEKWFHDGQNNL